MATPATPTPTAAMNGVIPKPTPAILSASYDNLPKTIKHAFCPPQSAPEKDRLGWIGKFLVRSERDIESSVNYQRLQSAVSAMLPGTKEKSSDGRLSGTEINLTKRQGQKIVATLSDISPAWCYDTFDKESVQVSGILTKLFDAIWQHPETRSRESIITLIQYMICGEGYLSPVWEDDVYSQINGSIGLKFRPLPLDSVYRSQMPEDKDIQKCYAVGLLNEMPITTAAMLYPEHADKLYPSVKPKSLFRRLGQKAAQMFKSPALNAAEEDRSRYWGANGGHLDTQMNTIQQDETVEIFDIYLQDCSVNKSSRRVGMGEPGTSSYYEVPYVGEPLPTKVNHPDGTPITRPANAAECLLYPYRRRIICTREHIIYDGPSPWLHGQVPVVRFALDDWPWDDVANPLVMESHSLNRMIESIYRGVEDMVNLRLNPPMKLPNTLSKDTTDRINLREPGKHIRVDAFESTRVETLHPPQMLQVEPQILSFIQLARGESDYLMGEPDMRNLAQAAQIPSADSVDRFLQAASPLATMLSRNMEQALMRVGNQTLFLLLQFADAPMRLKLLGKDGLTRSDFDYDPGQIVPAGDNPLLVARSQRIRQFGRQFYFYITPNSAYRIADQTRQMMIFQLWRDMRFPIGPWTLAKAFNIDIGHPPAELTDELSQWMYFQELTAKFSASLQAQAQLMMAQAQIEAQRMAQRAMVEDAAAGMGALGGMMGGGEGVGGGEFGGGGEPSSGRRPGRPPSGNEAPKMERKSDGRTTITES